MHKCCRQEEYMHYFGVTFAIAAAVRRAGHFFSDRHAGDCKGTCLGRLVRFQSFAGQGYTSKNSSGLYRSPSASQVSNKNMGYLALGSYNEANKYKS